MPLALIVTFGLLAFLAGCQDEGDVVPECEELGEFCHDAGDAGNAEAQACHEFGHDPANSAEDCTLKRIECEAVCTMDTDG